MTSAFSWQNSISLCPASFRIPRPNLSVTLGVSWLPTFAFQSPIMKRTSFLGVSSKGLHRTVQLQLLQCYWLGHWLGLLSYWMVCLGNEQRPFWRFWDCIQVLHVKSMWALESITKNKASGGDGIPVELFQILKDDAVKALHSICQHIWKTQQWPQDWKMSVFIPIPKKGNAKECLNYHTTAVISHASKVMLKILQASAIRELWTCRCSSWF